MEPTRARPRASPTAPTASHYFYGWQTDTGLGRQLPPVQPPAERRHAAAPGHVHVLRLDRIADGERAPGRSPRSLTSRPRGPRIGSDTGRRRGETTCGRLAGGMHGRRSRWAQFWPRRCCCRASGHRTRRPTRRAASRARTRCRASATASTRRWATAATRACTPTSTSTTTRSRTCSCRARTPTCRCSSTQCLSDLSFDFEQTNGHTADGTGPNMAVGSVQVNGLPATLHVQAADLPGRPERPGRSRPARARRLEREPGERDEPEPARLLAAGQQHHAERDAVPGEQARRSRRPRRSRTGRPSR